MTGQRGMTSIFYVILLIVGAALGTAGKFPLIGDTTITPEFLWNLVLQIATPTLLLFMLVKGVLDAINGRVTSQALAPGDFKPLLTLPEFWMGVVGTVVYILQVFFKITILDENTQAILANAILAVITQLLSSWGDRPPGQLPSGGIG